MTTVPLHDAEYAIREALYGVLSSALPIPVYDHVPDAAQFPYVEIGDGILVPWRTKTSGGEQATIQIHVWSKYSGFKEVIELSKLIVDTLTAQDIRVEDGQDVVTFDMESRETIKEPDGQTRHGVLRFAWRVSKQ